MMKTQLTKRRIVLLSLLHLHEKRKRRLREEEEKKRRFWVRRIFAERKSKGEFHLLVKDLTFFDHE